MSEGEKWAEGVSEESLQELGREEGRRLCVCVCVWGGGGGGGGGMVN